MTDALSHEQVSELIDIADGNVKEKKGHWFTLGIPLSHRFSLDEQLEAIKQLGSSGRQKALEYLCKLNDIESFPYFYWFGDIKYTPEYRYKWGEFPNVKGQLSSVVNGWHHALRSGGGDVLLLSHSQPEFDETKQALAEALNNSIRNVSLAEGRSIDAVIQDFELIDRVVDSDRLKELKKRVQSDVEPPYMLEDAITDAINYITDQKRLKSVAVLGGTIAGLAILRDQLPEITQKFRDIAPLLSNEAIYLSINVLGNTLMAPIGFLLSNYAHGKKLSRKELLGQVAFAAAWGVARHYVYSELSNFDEITPLNVSLKTLLYTTYYAAYGALYAAFSEYWSRVCKGASHLEAIKGVSENAKKKLGTLVEDPGIQLNLALNIANMFNPLVESRPTIAGALLIDYNMNVVRYSHGRKYGFWGYIKNILKPTHS